MSDAPERVWVKESHDSWGQYGHWYAHGKGGGTEYVRADRIAELEDRMAKAVWHLEKLDRLTARDAALVQAALAELKGQDND